MRRSEILTWWFEHFMTWGDGEKWHTDIAIQALVELRTYGEVTSWLVGNRKSDLWQGEMLKCPEMRRWQRETWEDDLLRNDMWKIWHPENWQMQWLNPHIWIAETWKSTTDIHTSEEWMAEMLKCDLSIQWLDEKWLGDLVTWWEYRNWDVT